MKFIVFYLQLVNSLEGLGLFFSSAVLTRRLRKHTATIEYSNFCTKCDLTKRVGFSNFPDEFKMLFHKHQ